MRQQHGFTLVEVMISMGLTIVVMAAVFGLLMKGQTTFQREPEIAALQQDARMGLQMITRDLTLAGLMTPAPLAIVPNDGGGLNPDGITIVYADPEVPISSPKCPGGGGGCGTIGQSATLFIDPDTFQPLQIYPEHAYHQGQVLFAIETADCNGDGSIGVVPFELTQEPAMAGGRLRLNHNPGNGVADLNLPGGFNDAIEEDCAVIGVFRVIQYRVDPFPTTRHPNLQRRSVGVTEWTDIGRNIENLQFSYGIGCDNVMVDSPATPDFDDPSTWITRVGLVLSARSETANLVGSSENDFQQESFIMKRFATSMALRNILAQAQSLDPVFHN